VLVAIASLILSAKFYYSLILGCILFKINYKRNTACTYLFRLNLFWTENIPKWVNNKTLLTKLKKLWQLALLSLTPMVIRLLPSKIWLNRLELTLDYLLLESLASLHPLFSLSTDGKCSPFSWPSSTLPFTLFVLSRATMEKTTNTGWLTGWSMESLLSVRPSLGLF
jgi:hypothetical protein